MDKVIIDLLPYLLTALFAGIGTYISTIHTLKIKVSLVEQKVEGLDSKLTSVNHRLDRKSDQFDEIQKELGEIKADIKALAAILEMRKTKGLS